MRTWNVVMMAWGSLVLGLLGVTGLACAVYPSLLLTLGDVVSGPALDAASTWNGRGVAALIGLLPLALLVTFILGNVKAAEHGRTVVLQNTLGAVKVSLSAIEDFSRVLKGKIEGLRDIKGRVVYTRHGLQVSARITVLAESRISEVTQKVQEGIQGYIRNTLGLEQPVTPTVIVAKVVSRENR